MAETILIVDDEPRFIQLIQVNLQTEGYKTLTASNGEEAIDMLVNQMPDMILLDIMMPKLNGIVTLNRIREFSNVPIIMLTAKGAEVDRVKGLEQGADDYVIKPFAAAELLARVKAVLRRSKATRQLEKRNLFKHGDLQIDYAKAEVIFKEKPISLSATEYRLLLQFSQNVGVPISTEELLCNVWGEQYKEDREILWVCISRLRQKLETDPKKPKYIATQSGVGYYMPKQEQE